jgi:abortive infection bacteriophage resistance protein
VISYEKPHLSFDEQLARMRERGMIYSHRGHAISALKRIGYYRLSAYTYPFRKLGDDGNRLDDYIDGASVEAAIALHDFDVKLRACVLAGLEAFEIALRTQVAYTLGRRDPHGHLDPDSALDSLSCSTPSKAAESETRYDVWLAKYEKRCQDAANEDFVRHFRDKYDGRLPIWAATEVMDLGGVVRLYGFLHREDRVKISRNFGPKREPDFRAWTTSLNVLRNHCAHGDRIWNRRYVYTLPEFIPAHIDDTLEHLQSADERLRRKVYAHAAVLASTLATIDPYTQWPRTFATQAKKLPGVPGVATHQVMGFPDDWQDLEIWKFQPKAVNK